ncbi:serine/arginine repetitive matrix protein 3-like [Lemur catta]|uniref:serine/arginine repetitive matrix protein 3-like n=1 Tax=Lemur catta TaxID=9447 RepID=UPI001E26E70B|nr:serine/arginine repetitive matrix protein 3-like [Lemur catta]
MGRVRRRVARGRQRRELEQRGAAARAGPLERAPAVHAARRRRPRVRTRQPPALRPLPRLGGRVAVGGRRGRGGAWGARPREARRQRGLLGGGGRPVARGRASGQRRVGAGVTCGRRGVSGAASAVGPRPCADRGDAAASLGRRLPGVRDRGATAARATAPPRWSRRRPRDPGQIQPGRTAPCAGDPQDSAEPRRGGKGQSPGRKRGQTQQQQKRRAEAGPRHCPQPDSSGATEARLPHQPCQTAVPAPRPNQQPRVDGHRCPPGKNLFLPIWSSRPAPPTPHPPRSSHRCQEETLNDPHLLQGLGTLGGKDCPSLGARPGPAQPALFSVPCELGSQLHGVTTQVPRSL